MKWLSDNAAIMAVIITGIFNIVISGITLWKQGKSKENITKLKQELENSGHNTQYMFDFKVKIYSELNEKMINAVDLSTLILPTLEENLPKDAKEKSDYIDKCDKDFCDSFNEFTKVQRKFMPFYDEKVIEETNKMMDEMNRLRLFFRYKYVDISMRNFVDNHFDEVENIHDYLDKEIEKVSSIIEDIFRKQLNNND